MKTMQDFTRRNRITASAAKAKSNPNMSDGEWAADASHWLVTLERGDRSMDVPFSQGSAHTSPPTAEDVLDCMASDASGYENARNYDDWADEYGFTHCEHDAYRTIGEQTDKLRLMLGTKLFNALVWKTERL